MAEGKLASGDRPQFTVIPGGKDGTPATDMPEVGTGGNFVKVMDPGINPVLPDKEQRGPQEIEVRLPDPAPNPNNPGFSPSIGSEKLSPVGRVLGAVRRFFNTPPNDSPRVPRRSY